MGKILDAIACKGLPARDIRNANLVNLWIFAWAVTLAVISLLSKYEWYSSLLPISIGFVINTGLALGVIFAYKRFLKDLDEMERQIQLESLALSVGVTFAGFSSYSILDQADVLPDLNPAYLIALMSLTYMAGLIIGRIRYR